MSEAFLRARADRMAKESLLTQASVQDAYTLPAVLQSPLIVQLKTDGAALEGEYRRLGQTFKPDYPKMMALKEKIEENKRQLRTRSEERRVGKECRAQRWRNQCKKKEERE